MEDVSKNDGRTVIFVSHNIAAVRELCNKGILLNEGQITTQGTIQSVIASYLGDTNNMSSSKSWDNYKLAPGNNIVKLWAIKTINNNKQKQQSFRVNERFGIEIQYEVFEEGHILWQGFNVFNNEGINVFDTHNVTSKWYNQIHPKGKYTTIAWIPENLLSDGDLIVSFAIFNLEKGIIHLHEKDVIRIQILDTFSIEEITSRGKYLGPFPGVIRPLLHWEDI